MRSTGRTHTCHVKHWPTSTSAHYDKDENEVDSDDESVTEGEDELNF